VSAGPRGSAWAVGYSCASDCFASSETDQTVILHWNGADWYAIRRSGCIGWSRERPGGVFVGFGFEWWRRARDDRARKRAELIRAGARLALAATAFMDASVMAGAKRDEPGRRTILNAHMAEMADAGLTINAVGDPELTLAGIWLAELARGAAPTNARERAEVLRTSNDTVRAAKL
jgi:hypothetical protein